MPVLRHRSVTYFVSVWEDINKSVIYLAHTHLLIQILLFPPHTSPHSPSTYHFALIKTNCSPFSPSPKKSSYVISVQDISLGSEMIQLAHHWYSIGEYV